jgi:hypothetical protein
MGRIARSGFALWILCVLFCGSASASGDYSKLYVVRRGWHIDIGFDTADLNVPLVSITAGFPGAQQVFFGFGDARYLRSTHHGPGSLLAALWPGDALLLVTALAASPEAAFGNTHVIRLRVSAMQSAAAQRFVWQSLTQKQAKDVSDRHMGIPGPYEGSAYFSAAERYSLAHTCNTWAAETLRAAGLPVASRRVIFARQLWSQVTSLQTPERAAGHVAASK